jgi:Glyoxalase-like domain
MADAQLDHVVVDARDRIDEAVQAYQALGFLITPRGHHTLGSRNNLVIFGTNYLELLGFGAGGGMRPELMAFPAGLNGLVFKTGNAEDTAARARKRAFRHRPRRRFLAPWIWMDASRTRGSAPRICRRKHPVSAAFISAST